MQRSMNALVTMEDVSKDVTTHQVHITAHASVAGSPMNYSA